MLVDIHKFDHGKLVIYFRFHKNFTLTLLLLYTVSMSTVEVIKWN